MKTIYKYTIAIGGEQEVFMPKGAELLHAAAQHDIVTFWALVDPAAEKEPRIFTALGTGWTTEEQNLHFVGTVLLQGGIFVFHVFEIIHAPL